MFHHSPLMLHRSPSMFEVQVPNVYPVDLFEHTWIFDRLDRLGISRYFQSEIKDCVTYVSRPPEDEENINQMEKQMTQIKIDTEESY
ncbi:ent-copalyl diphosphate synthase, chloroplastic-like [Vigna unguiculata]|uniref:ent-copalyl diphosphate synthase, chloroplastic-like n=1 Tax=Vigna unguiculata TaxID=3917 RepID=UPI001016F8C3|nr:ent-copalyl diphosphate synthase, chloroplastic-like [Vigna unguiculata]